MNVAFHQEKKNEKTKKGMKKAEEGRRQILEKLYATLLRSFRGQHGEEMVPGECRGNWDSWESQQQFRPNPNVIGDRTRTLKGLLIGAVVT